MGRRWEHQLLRDCWRCYAPSELVAKFYREATGARVEVVRPPFFLEVDPASDVGFELPSRYLLHFGNIGPVKGSDVLAKALSVAWERCPDLEMVWAGVETSPHVFAKF